VRALDGKTVLITGAARRIGRATTLALAAGGAGVIVHFHDSGREADELRQEVLARGGRCWLVRGDLENAAETDSLVERASSIAARPIDALINNASIFPVDTLASISRESLARCLLVNAWAPLALCRSFSAQTREGHIVNMLDAKLGGHRPSHVAYHASKHILALLTRLAALELAPGIAVNAVAPGLVLPPRGRGEDWLEDRARGSVPFARPGRPEDVADAVVFLLGSEYLTGQIIYVDGGSHLLEPTDGSHSR
jgi:pteridine reductase